jgi:capsular exopolysaccharide synthesis family protein
VSTPSFPRRSPGATSGSALDPYRRAVRRRPWLVAIIALLTVAVAVAWTATRSRDYQTTAQILVTPQSEAPATAGLPILTESVDPTRTLQTAATMLTSPRAAELTAQRLGGGATVDDVQATVTVQPQGNSSIVATTATATSPKIAAQIANAYADAALRTRHADLQRQVDAKLAAVQSRERSLSDPDSAAASALADQAATLQALSDGQDPNFSLLQAAPVPSSPSGTSPVLVIVLSVLVGLALGVGAALAVEQLDRRVRDEEELAALTPLPVLARVPLDRRHQHDDAAPTAGATEALRALQIQLEARGRDSRAVVMTSASEGDGKTATTIALARTLVSAGRRVVVLDFDLRKSEIGERLGVRSDLLRMLRNDGSLEDVLMRVDGIRNLRVLSAPPVGDAGALFQAYSRRLPDLIEQARAYADVVLIDTPPLGRVADALRLAARADDLLMVVRPGHTDRRELALSQETLQQLGIVPTGLILVGGSRRVPGYYGFTGGDAYAALVLQGGDGNGYERDHELTADAVARSAVSG